MVDDSDKMEAMHFTTCGIFIPSSY